MIALTLGYPVDLYFPQNALQRGTSEPMLDVLVSACAIWHLPAFAPSLPSPRNESPTLSTRHLHLLNVLHIQERRAR